MGYEVKRTVRMLLRFSFPVNLLRGIMRQWLKLKLKMYFTVEEILERLEEGKGNL